MQENKFIISEDKCEWLALNVVCLCEFYRFYVCCTRASIKIIARKRNSWMSINRKFNWEIRASSVLLMLEWWNFVWRVGAHSGFWELWFLCHYSKLLPMGIISRNSRASIKHSHVRQREHLCSRALREFRKKHTTEPANERSRWAEFFRQLPDKLESLDNDVGIYNKLSTCANSSVLWLRSVWEVFKEIVWTLRLAGGRAWNFNSNTDWKQHLNIEISLSLSKQVEINNLRWLIAFTMSLVTLPAFVM